MFLKRKKWTKRTTYKKGVAGADSDIDLLVDSRLRGLRFVGLMEEVRSTVDKDVDLLDLWDKLRKLG
ncbi:MAG: hypothetical protein IJO97_01530 [Lachnospiraceae bacterium]|nr:hypothetical protein [Lachnospiraceae bacterium]